MPEGANIGEVFLEGRLEFDDKSTPAFAAAVRRSMEASIRTARVKEAFANAISEGTDEGLNSASRSASAGGRRIGDNAGDAAKNSLERRLRDLNVRLPNLDLPVGDALRDLDRVKDELHSLRDNSASLKVHADTSEAEREIDRLQQSVRTRFEKDHQTFWKAAFTPDPELTENFFEVFRVGASRAMVGIFTSPVGILIGTGFMAALSTAIVAGGTALGAALTGAIVGGLGTGAIAAGIALVADDPKIQEAGNKIWQKLMGPDKEDAVEAVAKAQEKRDKIQESINKMDALGTGSSAAVPPEKTAALKSAEYDLQIAQNNEERAKVQARIDKLHATGGAYTKGKPGGDSSGKQSALHDLEKANEELATAEKTLADIEAKGPGLLKKAAQPFVEPTVRGIEILGESIDRVMPHIEGIFKTMAPYVEDFARAVGSILERVLPVLEKVLIAAAPVMDSIIAAIEALGPAIAGFLEKFSDPQVMRGAAMAFTDISMALIGLLPVLGDFLATLAKHWPVLKDALKDLKAAWDDLTGGDMGSVENMLENAYTMIRLITFVLELLAFAKNSWMSLWTTIKSAGSAIGGWLEDLGASLGRAKDQAVELGRGLKGWFEDLGASLGRAKDQLMGIWDGIKGWFSELGGSLSTAKDQLMGIWNGLKDKISEVASNVGTKVGEVKQFFTDLKNDISDKVENVKAAWKTFTDLFTGGGGGQLSSGGISGFFSDLKADISGAVEDMKGRWQSFREKIDDVWNNIQSKIQGVKDWFVNNVVSSIKDIIEDLKSAWQSFREKIDDVWNNVQNKIQNVKNWFEREVQTPLKNAIEDIKAAKESLQEKIRDVWDRIQEKIQDVKDWFDREVRSRIKDAIEDIKGAWQSFREKIDEVWSAVQRKIDEFKIWFLLNVLVPLLKAKQDLENGFENLKNKINEIFNNIRDKIAEAINYLYTNVWTPLFNFVTVTIPEKFAEMAGKIVGIWDKLRTGVSDIWNDMLRSGAEKINALIDLVNGVIRAVNSVPFIPDLPEISYRASGPAPAAAATPAPRDYFAFARGGAVHGGPPGTDTVPAMGPGGQRYRLDNGEHIWTKKEVQKIGGHGVMYGLRAAVRNGVIGMAAGGRVSGENNGLLNEHADHVHVAMGGPPMSFPAIIAAAVASGIPFSVSSTFRPGDRVASGGLSHHATGRAVDFGGHEQDKLAEYFEKLPGVIELIHRTATRDYAIFGGGDGGGAFSWLLSAAGKAAKGVIESAVNALKAGVQNMLPGADKKLAPGMVGGVFGGLGDAALKWFDEQVAAMATQVGPGNPDKNVMKIAYETAKSMGASSKLLLALFEAGFVESGFRNLGHQGAANDHDSLGFLQQRPSAGWPSPNDVPTATRSFISRALKIHGSHDTAGSLAQAVQISAFPDRYHQRRAAAVAALREFDPNFEPNGFAEGGRVGIQTVMDSGGWLEDDMSVVNRSGKPEPVFNHSQWQVLKANVSQEPTFPDEITLIVEGEPITARIKKNNAAGVQQLRRGRKP